ncbi:nuclear transport factor 2 family protein [Microbacterium sp. NPDC058389]|uniref:nuclear transport factor 2 family protein n=1 Tax=Microbacterium sp. NPDC058389 TaxID=3346475 RepID=UPI0036462E18
MNLAELAASYLEDVSNEPDAQRRHEAIERLFHEDMRYVDQDGPVDGREAFAARIDALSAMMGPTARFSLRRPAQAVDDAVLFHWRLGAPTEDADLEGADIALVRDGRIHRLYAVLD